MEEIKELLECSDLYFYVYPFDWRASSCVLVEILGLLRISVEQVLALSRYVVVDCETILSAGFVILP